MADTYACGNRLVLDESLVVERSDHEEVVRIAEGLHAALGRFQGARARGRAARAVRVGAERAPAPARE